MGVWEQAAEENICTEWMYEIIGLRNMRSEEHSKLYSS
jgi:hypothetical protein